MHRKETEVPVENECWNIAKFKCAPVIFMDIERSF
jgi:hypothetical protein